MAGFKSKKFTLNAPASEISAFLSDFSNFTGFIPEQVKDWRLENDELIFVAPMIGEIRFRYDERLTNYVSVVSHIAYGGMNTDLKLYFDLKDNGNETPSRVHLDAEVPMMYSMMLSNPVNNMLNMIADKLVAYYNK